MAFASNFGRILSPTFQPNSQAKKAGDWWLAGGIDPDDCIAAYQPKGAASYAASKVNLANPGTYDLTNGNDPSWSADNGWTFDGVNDHLYETTYEPTNTPFTVIVRLNNMKIDHSVSSAILGIRRPRNTGNNESNFALKFEQYNNTGKVGISSWGNPGERYKDLVSNFASPTGQDVIIAFTRSGTAIKYYVGTNTQTASVTFVFDATYKGLIIGGYFSPNFSGMDVPKGDLYALAYYHAALSDSQISAISDAMNDL